MKRILVSWIGTADVSAMTRGMNAKQKAAVVAVTGPLREIDGNGPVRALLDGEVFDEVHLLNSFGPVVSNPFRKWINQKLTIHEVKLDDPTSHAQILTCVEEVIGKLKDLTDRQLCFHLSPGTPAMASIWTLLGKSKYPATLYQTSIKRGVAVAEVPFDVTVDVLPKLMSEPDRFWQHLVDESTEQAFGFDQIVGNSDGILMAIGRAKRAALFDVTVLILGESGTGKELFASAIHRASHRRDQPFVSINCAAISSELLESELFGHVKGAFTGADKDRDGAFALADGGTLFLDEVGECDLQMQAKILRALQPPPGGSPSMRVFRPVGGSKEKTADVRIVAATNRDLATAIVEGQFREDLFYRLSMITLKLPPLRHRKGDVSLLANALLDQINKLLSESNRPGYVHKRLSQQAVKFIDGHYWPGNVRELYNTLIQAAVMQDSETLQPQDIASSLASTPNTSPHSSPTEIQLGDGFDMKSYLENIHRTLLQRAMSQANNVKAQAAKLLGMSSYQTLDSQLKKFDLD